MVFSKQESEGHDHTRSSFLVYSSQREDRHGHESGGKKREIRKVGYLYSLPPYHMQHIMASLNDFEGNTPPRSYIHVSISVISGRRRHARNINKERRIFANMHPNARTVVMGKNSRGKEQEICIPRHTLSRALHHIRTSE